MAQAFFRKKDIYILSAAALFLSAVWIFATSYEPEEDELLLFASGIFIILSMLLIFSFNYLLNLFCHRYMPWHRFAASRFLFQMIVGTVISLAALNIGYNLIKDRFTSAPPDPAQMILINIYGFAIILPLFSLFFGFKFLRAWRKSEIESEQLQKENARSQMMTLRNHLDPHFLFNNLNILSSLIDKDTQLSKAYLDKFAEVYRIILKTEFSDLSTVEEEMQLVNSYIFLLNIRFEDALFFNIDINAHDMTCGIPPLSIQMLIENAIKHNKASASEPVRLTIRSAGNNILEVSNNLQPKKYLVSERKGTGLENIRKRYEFFTDMELIVKNQGDTFSVFLPLIEIEYL